MGDEEMSGAGFAETLRVGFESVEVGLLPPTADGLVLGTMQRMRTGRIKALVVIGANEGLLPVAVPKEGLLSDDEKNKLFGQNIELGRREELRIQEEQIAIYKNIAKPDSFLWVGSSISDNDGGKLCPSMVFEKLREIFPDLTLTSDIVSSKEASKLIQSPGNTLKHMTDALRESIVNENQPDPEWLFAAFWNKRNNAAEYKLILDGLFLKNSRERIDTDLVESLFKKEHGEITLSPSRLERYGKCPFAFFTGFGLKPEELRIFEIAGREIGDIYHNCIMRFSKGLTEHGREVSGTDSGWMNVSRVECDSMVDSIIDEEASAYREGVFAQGAEEAYRTERIKAVCRDNAWLLVEHVRRGKIKSMGFEEKFGQSGSLPPIEVGLSNGRKVVIEGRIDRVDTLADGSVKIIDYKSGKEKFNTAEVKAGFRLQLMLYLKAARLHGAEPAGVFYYVIDEKSESRRMDGAVINKTSVIDSIAGDFRSYSDVIPIRKREDGSITGNSAGNLLSEIEFVELQEAVDKKVAEFCNELATGCIDVRPKRSGNMTACTYCGYKSICGFDTKLDGFNYERI
jgi:ATP-dependent helicase/nuclease subunit B